MPGRTDVRNEDRWLRLDAGSRNALSLSGGSGSGSCAPEIAAGLATRLSGFFRFSGADDPETFIAGATAVLAHYPEAVARKMCDPVRGLPSRSQWQPSMWEIGQACEREMRPIREAERREAERARTDAVIALQSTDEAVRERVAQRFRDLRERYGSQPKVDLQQEQTKLEGLAARYAADPARVCTPEMQSFLGQIVQEQAQ